MRQSRGRGWLGVRNLLMSKPQIGPFCDLAISKLLCNLCRMIPAQLYSHSRRGLIFRPSLLPVFLNLPT